MTSNSYVLTFLGDLMLGRLIDQLLPQHVDEPEEARHAAQIKRTYPHLREYNFSTPWGNTLDFLKKSDLVLGNLETAITTHPHQWPNKVFNYRMHSQNVQSLKVAGVDYVSLANNHTLDFNKEGLFDTVGVLEYARIAYAGAGRTVDEAQRPAVLKLKPKADTAGPEHEIHLYSFSDHPDDWSSVPEFNFIRYDTDHRAMLKETLGKSSTKPALKIVSMHWGPNYAWHPDADIKSLAHFLINECDVDIIHGHSSHHVQGVEVLNGKLTIYGCGDFVDDYAVKAAYRSDLSAAWNVVVNETPGGKLELQKLEVFPNRIRAFQAGLLSVEDADHDFVCGKIRTLSADMGTIVESQLGNEGQLVVNIT